MTEQKRCPNYCHFEMRQPGFVQWERIDEEEEETDSGVTITYGDEDDD